MVFRIAIDVPKMNSAGPFDAVFNILIVVAIISLAARRFRVPSTIALIFAGIIATVSPPFPLPTLSPEIFTVLLLPPILFQETLHSDVEGLIRDSDSVLVFAIAGTILMTLTVAFFVYFILGFTVIESFLLGIIISPTDPVAVISAFKEIGTVKRFQLIVSGESLFNDGVAIVLYSIFVTIITLGSITPIDILAISALSILGGVILGLVGGYAVHALFCWTDDRFTEVLISFIVAFGIFKTAESLGASGVIATVVAGLIINYRTRNYGGLGKASFEMLEALWAFVGFTASSLAFIFIGMNLDPAILVSDLLPMFLLFALVLVSRYIMVQGMAWLLERKRGKSFPRNWRLGLFWSGLRGAVSVVLVLGVGSLSLPNSGVLIALTFGVVLISNVIQGLSIPGVIKHLNISEVDDSSYHISDGRGENLMKLKYSPEGFDASRPRLEHIIFSGPEYFIFETRFGVWFVVQLQRVLESLNRYSIQQIPERTGGLLRKTIELITDIISKVLSWINSFIIKRKMDRRNRKLR